MMKQTRMGFSFYLRATAMFVLVAFTSTTVGWSAPALNTESRVLSSEIKTPSLADKITMPVDIGTVKETYRSELDSQLQTPGSGLIVHLEDAHGSVEAQLHQEKILRRLQEQYGLNTIFVEGGLGDLRPELLHFFKENQLNSKLMDKLTETGLVGGVERFFLNTEIKTSPAPKAYGVEDAKLYRRELELFREVYDGKAQSDKFLGGMRQSLLAKSAASFNKELKTFFREWLFQEELEKNILSHLSFLQKYAEDALRLDLTDAREQYDWPQLVRFFKLKKIEQTEHEVQSSKFEAEKNKLVIWLKRNSIGKDVTESLLRILEVQLPTPNSQLRTGEDFRSTMERFYEVAAPKGFKFGDYPVLSQKIGRMILSQELQVGDLLLEMERLNGKILGALAKTPEEKQGVAQYQEYLGLKKLLALELTREEYQQAYGVRSQTLGGGGAPSGVQKTFEQAIEFYKVAQQREQAIFKNMLTKMKEIKQPNAVLITGGFHSDGLSKFMKESGLSYVRIAPRISGNVDDSNYLRVMTLGRYGSAARSSARFAPLLNGPGNSGVNTDAFVRAELRNSIQEIGGTAAQADLSNEWLAPEQPTAVFEPSLRLEVRGDLYEPKPIEIPMSKWQDKYELHAEYSLPPVRLGQKNSRPRWTEHSDEHDKVIEQNEASQIITDGRKIALSPWPCIGVIIHNTRTKKTYAGHSNGAFLDSLEETIHDALRDMGNGDEIEVIVAGGGGSAEEKPTEGGMSYEDQIGDLELGEKSKLELMEMLKKSQYKTIHQFFPAQAGLSVNIFFDTATSTCYPQFEVADANNPLGFTLTQLIKVLREKNKKQPETDKTPDPFAEEEEFIPRSRAEVREAESPEPSDVIAGLWERGILRRGEKFGLVSGEPVFDAMAVSQDRDTFDKVRRIVILAENEETLPELLHHVAENFQGPAGLLIRVPGVEFSKLGNRDRLLQTVFRAGFSKQSSDIVFPGDVRMKLGADMFYAVINDAWRSSPAIPQLQLASLPERTTAKKLALKEPPKESYIDPVLGPIDGRRAEVRAGISGERVEWSEEIGNAVLTYVDESPWEKRQKIARLVQATALNRPNYLTEPELTFQDPHALVQTDMVNFIRNLSAMRAIIEKAGLEAEIAEEYIAFVAGLEKAVKDARAEARAFLPKQEKINQAVAVLKALSLGLAVWDGKTETLQALGREVFEDHAGDWMDPPIRKTFSLKFQEGLKLLLGKKNLPGAKNFFAEVTSDARRSYEKLLGQRTQLLEDYIAKHGLFWFDAEAKEYVFLRGIYQKYTIGSRKISIRTYKEDRFDFLWEAFRSVDHQIETELSEILRLRGLAEKLRKYEGLFERAWQGSLLGSLVRPVNLTAEDWEELAAVISEVLSRLRATWIAEKQTAAAGLVAAGVAIAPQKVFRAYTGVSGAVRLLEGRISNLRSIIYKLENGRLEEMRRYLRSVDEDLSWKLKQMRRSSGNPESNAFQHNGFALLQILKRKKEPEFHGLLGLVAGAKENPDPKKRIFYLELARKKLEAAKELHEWMRGYREAFKRFRLSGQESDEASEAAFREKYEEFLKDRKIPKGSTEAKLWKLRFYQAVKVPLLIDAPKKTDAVQNELPLGVPAQMEAQPSRIPNPEFEAFNILIYLSEVQDIGILKDEHGVISDTKTPLLKQLLQKLVRGRLEALAEKQPVLNAIAGDMKIDPAKLSAVTTFAAPVRAELRGNRSVATAFGTVPVPTTSKKRPAKEFLHLEKLQGNFQMLVTWLLTQKEWRTSANNVKNMLIQMLKRSTAGTLKLRPGELKLQVKGPEDLLGLEKNDKVFLGIPGVGDKTLRAFRAAFEYWKQQNKKSRPVPQETTNKNSSKSTRSARSELRTEEIEQLRAEAQAEVTEALAAKRTAVADYAGIAVKELDQILGFLREGREMDEATHLLFHTYIPEDPAAEGVDIRDIPAFQKIRDGDASAGLKPDLFRARHMIRADRFFRALTHGDFEYFVRRLPKGTSEQIKQKYRENLAALKAAFNLLSSENKRILWLEIKLHDSGFSAKAAGLGHEARGSEIARKYIEEELKISGRAPGMVADVISRHSNVGFVYLGELRMEKFLRETPPSLIPFLIFHVIADGAAASPAMMPMPPDQLRIMVKWLDAGEREKIIQHFDQYRLEMMGRPYLSAPLLSRDEVKELNASVKQIFGTEKSLLRGELKDQFDITDAAIVITCGLVRVGPGYRNYAKFMKLLAHISAILGTGDVAIKSDLLRNDLPISREELMPAAGKAVAVLLTKVPEGITLDETREALKGLPEGPSDFYGIPVFRTGNEVILQVGKLLEVPVRGVRAEMRLNPVDSGTSSASRLSAMSEMRKDTAIQVVVEKYDPAESQIGFSANPVPSGRFRYDQAGKVYYWDGKEDPLFKKSEGIIRESQEPDAKTWRVELSWEEHEKAFATHTPEFDLHSYGNLYHNKGFVAFDGKIGKLYYGGDEDFEKAPYTMFVVWKDGRVTSEELRFQQIPGDVPGKVKVYRFGMTEPLQDKISFAIFGQRLIHRGKDIPLLDVADQFEDLFQLYRLPQFMQNQKGSASLVYGRAIGVDELARWRTTGDPANKTLFMDVVRNDGRMAIDLKPYLKEKESGKDIYRTIKEIETGALKPFGYKDVPREKAGSLERGEYFIDENSQLHIHFLPFPYPHHVLGITESGKVVSILYTGSKHNREGVTLQDLPASVRECYKDQASDPIVELFVIAQGKDSLRRRNGKLAEHSPSINEIGTAALLFQAPVAGVYGPYKLDRGKRIYLPQGLLKNYDSTQFILTPRSNLEGVIRVRKESETNNVVQRMRTALQELVVQQAITWEIARRLGYIFMGWIMSVNLQNGKKIAIPEEMIRVMRDVLKQWTKTPERFYIVDRKTYFELWPAELWEARRSAASVKQNESARLGAVNILPPEAEGNDRAEAGRIKTLVEGVFKVHVTGPPQVLTGGYLGKSFHYTLYQFETQEFGRLAFKYIWSTKEKARYAVELMQHLKAKGLPVPVLIPRRDAEKFEDEDDRFIVPFQGGFYVLETFLKEGEEVLEENAGAERYAAVGRMAARIQNATEDFNPRHHFIFQTRWQVSLDLRNQFEGFDEAVTGLESVYGPENELVRYITQNGAAFKTLVARNFEYFSRNYPREGLRRGPIHNDLHFGNLKFKGSEIAALFDFNLVQEDERIAEFNNLVLGVKGNGFTGFKPEAFRAILEGYEKEIRVPLAPEEKIAIWEIVRLRLIAHLYRGFFAKADKPETNLLRDPSAWPGWYRAAADLEKFGDKPFFYDHKNILTRLETRDVTADEANAKMKEIYDGRFEEAKAIKDFDAAKVTTRVESEDKNAVSVEFQLIKQDPREYEALLEKIREVRAAIERSVGPAKDKIFWNLDGNLHHVAFSPLKKLTSVAEVPSSLMDAAARKKIEAAVSSAPAFKIEPQIVHITLGRFKAPIGKAPYKALIKAVSGLRTRDFGSMRFKHADHFRVTLKKGQHVGQETKEPLVSIDLPAKPRAEVRQNIVASVSDIHLDLNRREARTAGLFAENAKVREFIRYIQDHWDEIIREGAFAFDYDKTLADAMSELPFEMAMLLAGLLKKGVKIAIISGTGEEALVKLAFDPIRKAMGEDKTALRHLTFYASGGATLSTVNKKGVLVPEASYSIQLAIPEISVTAAQEAVTGMAKKRFGLGSKTRDVAEGWRQSIRKKFPAMRFDDSWTKGNGKWRTAVMDSQEFWGRVFDGKAIIPMPAVITTRVRGKLVMVNIMHLPESPVDVRRAVEERIFKKLDQAGVTGLRTYSEGISAIDVMRVETNKGTALLDFIQRNHRNPQWTLFFGDRFYFWAELDPFTGKTRIRVGNDEAVAHQRGLEKVNTLAVNEETLMGSGATLHIGRGELATRQFLQAIQKPVAENRKEIRSAPQVVQVNGVKEDDAAGTKAAQEDRFVNEEIPADAKQGGGRLMAVIDGHGGKLTSEVIRRNLPRLFREALRRNSVNIRQVLEEVFNTLQIVTSQHESGATLALTYIPHNEKAAYVMTVGDSPAYILKDQTFFHSPEHNVRNPDEILAIEAWAKDHGKFIRKHFDFFEHKGENYLNSFAAGKGIQVTRSFGDKLFEGILIRKPFIDKWDLSDAKEPVTVLLASDGVYGERHREIKMKRDEAIQSLLSRKNVTARDFVDAAGGESAQDNVTAILWRFNPTQTRAEARAGHGIRDARLPKNMPQDFMILSPVLNRADQIETVIREARERGYLSRLLFVDDGSTDGAAKKLLATPRDVSYISFNENRQKEGALLHAIQFLKSFPEYFISLDGDSFLNVKGDPAAVFNEAIRQMKEKDQVARPLDIAADLPAHPGLAQWLQSVQWYLMMRLRDFRVKFLRGEPGLIGAGVLYRTDIFLKAMEQKKTGFAAGDIELHNLVSDLGDIGMPAEGATVMTGVFKDFRSFFSQQKRWFAGTWEALPWQSFLILLIVDAMSGVSYFSIGFGGAVAGYLAVAVLLSLGGLAGALSHAVYRKAKPLPEKSFLFRRDVLPLLPLSVLLNFLSFFYFIHKTGFEYLCDRIVAASRSFLAPEKQSQDLGPSDRRAELRIGEASQDTDFVRAVFGMNLQDPLDVEALRYIHSALIEKAVNDGAPKDFEHALQFITNSLSVGVFPAERKALEGIVTWLMSSLWKEPPFGVQVSVRTDLLWQTFKALFSYTDPGSGQLRFPFAVQRVMEISMSQELSLVRGKLRVSESFKRDQAREFLRLALLADVEPKAVAANRIAAIRKGALYMGLSHYYRTLLVKHKGIITPGTITKISRMLDRVDQATNPRAEVREQLRDPQHSVLKAQGSFEGRSVEKILGELSDFRRVMEAEQKDALANSQQKVADFAQISLDEIDRAIKAMTGYRDSGAEIDAKTDALIRTYVVFDPQSEIFRLDEIPEFITIQEGGLIQTGPDTGKQLAANRYRSSHMRRAETLFRALTSGNFDYYLRRLPPGEDPVEFERGLLVFKKQYDTLTLEEKRMIWAEVKLHDIGFAESPIPVGHEKRSATLARKILTERTPFTPSQIDLISSVIEKHTSVGWTYLGEQLIRSLIEEKNETVVKFLLLHNQADGPASGVGEMRMTARQVVTIGSWFDPEVRRKVAKTQDEYRILKTARTSMIARDPNETERKALRQAMEAVFGEEDAMIREQLRNRLDVTDSIINVFYSLVRSDPSFHEFLKFWKFLAHAGALVGGRDVTFRSDLASPVSGLLRDDAIQARTDLIVQAIKQMPEGLKLEDVRAGLGGLADNTTREYYGISLKRVGNEILIQTNPIRAEVRLTDAEKQVAHRAGDMFRIGRFAREELWKALEALNPVAYAMERAEVRANLEKLLTDPAKLRSGQEQISVVFKDIPQLTRAEIRALVDVMAKSKFLAFQIVVPGAAPAELNLFKEALVRKVNKVRTVKGGVNLSVVSDEASISKFVGRHSENALIFDMREGAEVLAKLMPDVSKAGRGKETLFVYSDRALPLAQKSYALLAAINALLEKHIPKELQAASHILRDFAENLRIAAAADQSILQAA